MNTHEFLNNTKTIEYIKNNGKFFTFYEGKVYEIELVKAVFPISDTDTLLPAVSVKYEVKHNGGKKLYPLHFDDIYTDKECLTKPSTQKFSNATLENNLGRLGVGNICKDSILKIHAWVFGDEGIKNITPSISKVEYDYTTNAFNIEFDKTTKAYTKMYDSEEECLNDQEFDVYDKDGNLTEHYVGINKRLAFDEKQMDIINRLNSVLDEAKANDIYIIMNLYNYGLDAINIKPLKKQTDYPNRIEIADYCEKNKYRDCDLVDLIEKSMPINYFGTDINEDYRYAIIDGAKEIEK